MTSLLAIDRSPSTPDALRPVNLRRDLAQVADLIELVFADRMDAAGRAAIREMRYLSRMSIGVNTLGQLNELVRGIAKGYVWEEDNRVVGNVSIYPADNVSSSRKTFVIANVGVHPDYRGRGIARALMQACYVSARQYENASLILQVDEANEPAVNLYRSLNFVQERVFTTWVRRHRTRNISPTGSAFRPMRPKRNGWQDEFALAQTVRPNEKGGLGWLRPTHQKYFRRSIGQQLRDWLMLAGTERYVIHDDQRKLVGVMMYTNQVASSTRITLLIEPSAPEAVVRAFLETVIQRVGHTALTLEHPADDTLVSNILGDYGFRPTRHLIHMRYNHN